LHAPAAERNAEPILEILRAVLPQSGCVLEIASGTGQHCAVFAAALTNLTFQPSEHDASKLESIRAWTESLRNAADPVELDVTASTWPVGTVDAVFCANMIHIAPIEAMYGLLKGAARHLRSGGLLAIYGPFMEAGEHTAPSNAAFDASLRSRDPRWGIRDLETVKTRARSHGLTFDRAVDMPANNKTVLFRRGAND
jgi:SAM-dependent methyltransferase